MQSWKQIINNQRSKQYFSILEDKVLDARENNIVYPNEEDVYKAFDLCEYKDVKVVIIGQDPYHGKNQANGLSFSVNEGVKLPPSLRNIYTELESDLNIKRSSGDLSSWAEQGVLMLNKILTVNAKSPASHQKFGWDEFTDEIILSLNDHPNQIIYVLWGNYAKSLKKIISDKHIIIESAHPSPLSSYRGFFGSKPFSKINNYLIANNREAIDWGK